MLNRKSIPMRALVLLATALFFSAAPLAVAKEKQTMKAGVTACKAWCDRNNQTVGSQSTCYRNCEKYWLCQGSDSTAITCTDGKALSAAPATTPTTPPRTFKSQGAIVGQGTDQVAPTR